MEEEYEYLEIDISRQQTSTICLKVPKGWRPNCKKGRAFILEEAQKMSNYDWDSDGWELTLEQEGLKICSEKEAIGWDFLDVTDRLPKKEVKDENQLDLL